MIAIAEPSNQTDTLEWHTLFLDILPQITTTASLAFKGLPPETREDLIEEVIAHAVVAFKSLHDKGKVDLAYPSVLALHGIKRVKIGRQMATPMNCKDVSSLYCQLQKGVRMERLDHFDEKIGG